MTETEFLSNGYLITLDRNKMIVAEVHTWLSTEAYWCKNIPYNTVQTAFNHSAVAGVLRNNHQIGYARLITDYATFGYLADVFITEPHRGKGLSKAMLSLLLHQPWVINLRNILLATWDAHGLYAQLGFGPPERPDRLMQILKPDPYSPPAHSPSNQ